MSPGVARRLTSSPESTSFPSGTAADAKPADIALAVAGEGKYPAVVCFLSLSDRDLGDRTSGEEGKAADMASQNSMQIQRLVYDKPNLDDLAMSLKFFHVMTVDVTAIPPSASTCVNRLKAPYVAVVGLDGKAVKVLGPALFTKAELLSALKAALKPKMDLERFLVKERRLVKDIQKHDALVADIAAKNSQAEKAPSPAIRANLKAAVAKLEPEAKKAQAGLDAQTAAIQADLDAAGLERLP